MVFSLPSVSGDGKRKIDKKRYEIGYLDTYTEIFEDTHIQ